MGYNMQVSVDYKEVEEFMGEFKNQAPYVMAQSINDTLLDSQQEVTREVHQKFMVRRPNFIKRSIKMMKFAKKKDVEGIIGVADVAGKPTSDILSKFEEGGTKTASGNVAVATEYIKPAPNQIISKSKKPRNLKNAFKYITKAGQDAIAQVKGRGKKKQLRVAYMLKDGVKIDDRLGFTGTVLDTINKRFDRHFERWYNKAIETIK